MCVCVFVDIHIDDSIYSIMFTVFRIFMIQGNDIYDHNHNS